MKSERKFLWEMLIPCSAKGKTISPAYHKKLDNFIYKFSRGLTIHPASNGSWVSWIDGELVKEKVLPLRFVCTRKALKKIGQFARKHYNQQAIFACLVSEQIFLFTK